MRSVLSLGSLPKVGLETSNVRRVKHRSFPTSKGGTSVVSFLHSSFLWEISAVMLWSTHVQKVYQVSKHPCKAKQQTRCDDCFDCHSVYLFIPTDSGMPTAVDPQESLQPKTVHGCV